MATENRYDDFDTQSQNLLQGIQFLDFDALQNNQFEKDPFEKIRTNKSFEEISNEIALKSPFGKNSFLYAPQYITQNINFEKLVEIIVADKDILFNYEDYIGYETKKVNFTFFNDPEGARIDRMVGNPSGYDGYETSKTEIPLKILEYSGERELDLKGKINTIKEIVNIFKNDESDKTGGLEFEFNYKSKIVSYKKHYYYVGKSRVFENNNTQNNIAFSISTNNYQDFIAFQQLSKRVYIDNTFETAIATAFLNAINEVSQQQDMLEISPYNNDKTLNLKKLERLDWLYEKIPPFVAKQLDFGQTIENVFKLSHYDKGSIFTDTTKSITTVLSRLDPKTVYSYFMSNPQKLIDLLAGFSDDAIVESFCNYLTALTFIYLQPDVTKARKFNLSDDTHIETNILYGDKKGKVELTNELQLPSISFPGLSLINLFTKDIEINNPKKQSNQFHPLELIYITHYDETIQEEVAVPTIALYAKYLGDKTEWSDVTQASMAVFDVISIIVSGGALATGIKATARLFAIIDIAVSTINLALLNDALKKELNKTEAGRWFVSYWPIISLCVGVGTISYYLAKGILKYGKQVSQQLQNEEKLAKQIDELVEESKKVAGMAENISVPNLKMTVEEFNAGLIKLSKIKPSEAFKHLDEAMIYFNHHIVDGKIVQIGDENCVNVVEVVEEFLKTGKINVAKPSTFQEISKLQDIYDNKFLTMSIPSTKNVMKEGERGIIFGYRGLYKKGHVFNVLKKNGELIFVDAQKYSGKAIINNGYESFKYLKTN